MAGAEIDSGCLFWWGQKGVTRDVSAPSGYTPNCGNRTPPCALNQTNAEVQLPSNQHSCQRRFESEWPMGDFANPMSLFYRQPIGSTASACTGSQQIWSPKSSARATRIAIGSSNENYMRKPVSLSTGSWTRATEESEFCRWINQPAATPKHNDWWAIRWPDRCCWMDLR